MQEANAGNVQRRLPTIDPLPTIVERIESELKQKTGEPLLKTGFEFMDRGTFGLHAGHLCTIAGRPGNGKTTLACNIAFELAQAGVNVAFFSLEMSKESILSKIFCSTYKVNAFRFLIGKITPEEREKLSHFKKMSAEIPLKIIDDYCHTQDEMYHLIEFLKFRPQVLFVDHIQHIRSSEGRRSDRENYTEYLRYLKEIAMRNKIAVVCLSQINREGDEKPSIKTLKGTGALEEMSDSVFLLHLLREQTSFDNAEKDLINGQVELAKNRFGPTGVFEIMFNPQFGTFSNMETYRTLPSKPDWTDKENA